MDLMKHAFSGTPFTVGVEEELMLVDPETLELAQGIEPILADFEDGGAGERGPGMVKPELLEAVLEIATDPCRDLAEAETQIRSLRTRVAASAERHGMCLGAAGTHPTARWEDQEVTDRPRYRQLIEELGWIARQEMIFGTHVHIGMSGEDKAIYVVDGMRRHIPLMLALSANSPMWQGVVTGLHSSRTPVFRHFPRVGIPPHYGNWEIYSRRVALMVEAGAIQDYTYLWWDIRPHPNLGTIEVRMFDQQTHVHHTIGLAALSICLAHRYSVNFDEGKPLVEVPTELIDDDKVRAALRGLEGDLVDFPRPRKIPAAELARQTLAELEGDAAELGCQEQLASLKEIIDSGTGARHQLDLLEAGDSTDALIRAICEET